MSSEKNTMETRQRNTLLHEVEEQDMRINLLELFLRLVEKLWLIVLVGVVTALAGGLYTHFFIPDTYTATAKLYVIGSEDAVINLSALNLGDKLADDYVQVFNNRDVYETVQQGFPAAYGYKLPYSFQQVQEKMKVTQLGNTRILKITFSCSNPEHAMDVVEAYLKTTQSFMDVRMGTSLPEQPFESTYVSSNPTSPNMSRNVTLAFIAGVLLVTIVLLGQFILDDRIRTPEQLEKRLGIPTLGLVPVQETDDKNCYAKGEKA